MARITVEDCLVQENNRFALVQLAAKRTRQMLRGSKPKLDEVKNKPVVVSLREIADGLTRWMTDAEIEEARIRKESNNGSSAEVAGSVGGLNGGPVHN